MVELNTCSGSTSTQQQQGIQTQGVHCQSSSQGTDARNIISTQLQSDTEQPIIVNASDISAFLSKLYQQQQQIMALQQSDHQFEVNQTSSNINHNHGIDIWADTNSDTVSRNNGKLSVNLSALKHDHPLIASAVDNGTNRTSNGLCHNDGILIASLPPSTPTLMTQIAQCQSETFSTSLDSNNNNNNNNNNRNKPLCMPYGYCYDESKVQGYTQFAPNVPSEMDTATISNCNYDDDWMLDDDDFYSSTNNYNQSIYDFRHPCASAYTNESIVNIESIFQVDKADLKSGPTLAQLNANLTSDIWDSLDLDDLLNSAQHDCRRSSTMPKSKYASFGGANFGTRCQSLTNNGTASNAYPMDLEYDAKLQENIDYLTSLLFSSKSACGGTIPSVSSAQLPSQSQSQPQSQLITSEIPSPSCSSLTSNIKQEVQTSQTSSVTNGRSNTMLSNLLSVQKKQTSQNENQLQTQTPSSVIIKNTPSLEVNSLNRVRNNSMSTEYSASSHDEGFASQPEDSDNDDDDLSSDDESFYGDYDAADLLGASTSDDANNKWSLNMGRTRKGGERRYFWQYNVQSKGPKGTRIASVDDAGDPHILKEISDPVFSPECQIEGVKHSGKARRGDGNDLTPNPKKLLMIGLELKKLSRTINDLTPVAEVPLTARSKSRKEKNKLASRACRLKKKAQHEANKMKLYGLQQEHKKMMLLIAEIKKMLRKRIDGTHSEQSASVAIEQLVKQKGPSFHVAGRTSDFVNSILDNVSSGISNGGMDKL